VLDGSHPLEEAGHLGAGAHGVRFGGEGGHAGHGHGFELHLSQTGAAEGRLVHGGGHG